MASRSRAAPDRLFCGDNLRVMRDEIANESVDLVYLDPPFNSNASYNVLFAERDGTKAAAQIRAFGDTWRWDQAANRTYQDVVEQGGPVSQALQAFDEDPKARRLVRLDLGLPLPTRAVSIIDHPQKHRVAACSAMLRLGGDISAMS
jgi:hypothetical protein